MRVRFLEDESLVPLDHRLFSVTGKGKKEAFNYSLKGLPVSANMTDSSTSSTSFSDSCLSLDLARFRFGGDSSCFFDKDVSNTFSYLPFLTLLIRDSSGLQFPKCQIYLEWHSIRYRKRTSCSIAHLIREVTKLLE